MATTPKMKTLKVHENERNWTGVEASPTPPYIHHCIMVCFHCPTPIPILIPIPILMELASIVMCRTVSTEPTLIPMHAPIPMPMGTVPILAPTSVLIRCNLTNFHCNFCIRIGPSGALLHTIRIGTIIGIGIGVRQWKHTITPALLCTQVVLLLHIYLN